jgi:spore germination protein KC
MRVVVCQGTAREFILENKTFIGTNSSKAIELMFEQSKNSGYFPDVIFTDFYIDLLTPYGQPTAIYAGVNKNEDLIEGQGVENPPLITDQDIPPGNIPRKGGTKKELFGTAVFDGDKMVGILHQNETRFYLMGIGEFRRGFFTLEDPNKPGYVIVVEAQLAREPEVKARFEDGRPVIDLKITIDADIISIQSRKHYERLENIEGLEKVLEDYFNRGLAKTIDKTQTQWNADIFHFGKKVAGNFRTIQELNDYNWIAHYQDAKVNSQVKVSLRRSGFIYGASPIRGTTSVEGEVGESEKKE